MSETSSPGKPCPTFCRHLAPIVAWSIASIALGLVVGLAALSSPARRPLGSGAAPRSVLSLCNADLPPLVAGLIRQSVFFVMLIVDISRSFYYMVSSPTCLGLSARPARSSTKPSDRRFLRPVLTAICSLVRRSEAFAGLLRSLPAPLLLRGRGIWLSCVAYHCLRRASSRTALLGPHRTADTLVGICVLGMIYSRQGY